MYIGSISINMDIVPATEICQCCLSQNDLVDMKMSCDDSTKTYLELFTTCLSYESVLLDTKTSYICKSCTVNLISLYNFKQCVDQSRSVLLKWKEQKSETQTLCNNEALLHNAPENETAKLLKQNTGKSEVPYHLDKNNLVCQICDAKFPFYKQLVDHMPQHFPNHVCDVCGRVFSSRRSLLLHRKIHSNTRYECNICKKKFKTQRYLNTHKGVVHCGESLKYKCQECDNVFITYNARLKHCVEVHGKEDKIYKCSQCIKRYRLSSQLSAHIRSKHLQEKKHCCLQCTSLFFTKRSLNKHLLKHSNNINMNLLL